MIASLCNIDSYIFILSSYFGYLYAVHVCTQESQRHEGVVSYLSNIGLSRKVDQG